MDKVQLATRIPKDLDLEIETASKDLKLKKQETIIQILRYGLVVIKSLQTSSQQDQSGSLQLSNSSLSLTNNLFTNPENTSVTQPLANIDLEKRLTYLESRSADSSQLTELVNLMLELRSVISQPTLDLANASSQVQVPNISSASSAQEQLKQKSTLPAENLELINVSTPSSSTFIEQALFIGSEGSVIQDSDWVVKLALLEKSLLDLNEQLLELKLNQELSIVLPASIQAPKQVLTVLSKPQTEVELSTEYVKQLQELPVPSPDNVSQEIKSTIENSDKVHSLRDTSIYSTVNLDPEKSANLMFEESAWLTVTEAYNLAKVSGYQKAYQSFRAMLIDSPNAERYQLEWGFEYDIARCSSSSTKRRSIRLRQEGRVVQALQAQSGTHQITAALFNMASIDISICPTCNTRLHKRGIRKGLQRYQCETCNKPSYKPVAQK